MKTLSLLSAFALLIGTAGAQTADEKIAALEARVAKLEALVAKLTAGKPAPAAVAKTPAGNKYGIPNDVLERIKAPIIARYPDNFSMQKTLIEAQVEDYKQLQEK